MASDRGLAAPLAVAPLLGGAAASSERSEPTVFRHGRHGLDDPGKGARVTFRVDVREAPASSGDASLNEGAAAVGAAGPARGGVPRRVEDAADTAHSTHPIIVEACPAEEIRILSRGSGRAAMAPDQPSDACYPRILPLLPAVSSSASGYLGAPTPPLTRSPAPPRTVARLPPGKSGDRYGAGLEWRAPARAGDS